MEHPQPIYNRREAHNWRPWVPRTYLTVSVFVWNRFWMCEKHMLQSVVRYQVLRNHVFPLIRSRNVTLQQNNARPDLSLTNSGKTMSLFSMGINLVMVICGILFYSRRRVVLSWATLFHALLVVDLIYQVLGLWHILTVGCHREQGHCFTKWP
jgi:hypothetical protein